MGRTLVGWTDWDTPLKNVPGQQLEPLLWWGTHEPWWAWQWVWYLTVCRGIGGEWEMDSSDERHYTCSREIQ